MADPFENRLVDKRVVQRYIGKGLLAEKDFDQYLKKLPDLTEQATVVESAIEEDDKES